MTLQETKLPQADAIKALADKVGVLMNLYENSPKLKDAGYIAPDSEEDHAESKSFGDFLTAVKNKNARRLASVYKSRFMDDEDESLPSHVKVAMAEDAGASGGYGVPVEYGQTLLDISKDFNALRRAGATVVSMNKRSREYPVMDIETAPGAGSTAFAGGVSANWINEADAITESEPRFRLIELVAHKLATYALMSSEVRADFNGDLDGLLMRQFAKAIGAAEEYQFFRGTGVGTPFGILSSGALLSPQRATASTIVLGDLAQMVSDFTPDSYGSAAWFVSPNAIDQLMQLVTTPLTWLQSLKAGLPVTLLGWPVFVVGCLSALDTAGDIILADPTYYLIGDHSSGVRIAFSEHYKFANDQLAWRVTKRVDGQPMIDNAITGEDASTTYSHFVVLAAGP